MSALDKLITKNLDKLDDLLSHSSRPVGLPATEAAREAVLRGVDPAWAQAEAKGLPLSTEEIERRAQAMGFNRKAYHGTTSLPDDFDIDRSFWKRQVMPSFVPEFEELLPRRFETDEDLHAGPSTIATYLGPHAARDPEMSFPFSGFMPHRLAEALNVKRPERRLQPRQVAKMKMDELLKEVEGVRDRPAFEDALEYELKKNKYGRMIPLRLRGGVRDVPQEKLLTPDDPMPLHDDRAVDMDVVTHALTTDPSWLQGSRLMSEGHAAFDPILEEKAKYLLELENQVNEALTRGNPESAIREIVHRNPDLLKALSLADYDPQSLEHMLDAYRSDYTAQGTPLLRYRNTVDTETEYSPSEDAYIILDPSAVRSESAIFDPDLRHLSGLNYAGGGKVGSLAKIVAAALRGTDNEGKELVIPGRVHAEAVDDYLRAIGEDPDMLTGGEIDDLITDLVEHGFVDESGAFLTRKEAAERAAALDQLTDWGKKRYGYQEEARALGLKPGMEGLHTGEIGDITDDDVQKALNLINPDGYAKGGTVKSLMAAVRDVLTGNVYKGPTHAHAIYDMALDKYGDVDAPDVMSLIDQYSDDAEDGFVTPKGRFMTREQAAKYMKPELRGRYVTDQDELFSEDLGVDVERHQNELAKELDPDYYVDESEDGMAKGGTVKKLAEIVAAALRGGEDDAIYQGADHWGAMLDYLDKKHGIQLEDMSDDNIDYWTERQYEEFEPGFLDANGKFLTRDQALKRAAKTGQHSGREEDLRLDDGLHSGDLDLPGHDLLTGFD